MQSAVLHMLMQTACQFTDHLLGLHSQTVYMLCHNFRITPCSQAVELLIPPQHFRVQLAAADYD